MVHIDDIDGEDEDVEEEVEIRDDEIDAVNLDEEEEREAIGGILLEIQSIEESDAKKIVDQIMTSFPHSPRKALVQPGSEKASTKLVEVSSESPNTQPISGSVLLSVTLNEVPNTSSIKQ